jgi:hypothetical protein
MTKEQEALKLARAYLRWIVLGISTTDGVDGQATSGVEVDKAIKEALAQPAQSSSQELDCNDCKHANRSEIVGPCADCIPHFPTRPMFAAKKMQPAQKPFGYVSIGNTPPNGLLMS